MSVSEYVKKLAKAKKAAKNSDNETKAAVRSMTDEEKAAALKKKRTKDMNDAMKERKNKVLEQENPKKEKPKTLSPGDFPPLKTSA